MSELGINVLVATGVVQGAIAGTAGLAEAHADERSYLEKIDEDLYNYWDGVAGDNFRYATYAVEQNLKSLSTRQNNASEALDETLTKFGFMDAALEESINIET